MSALRQDRRAWQMMSIFVLLLPFFHPLSEANAANRPFSAEICTTFGQTGRAAVPGMADDCPLCIIGDETRQLFVPTAFESVAFFGLNTFAIEIRFPHAVSQGSNDHTRWLHPPGQAPPLSS